MAVLNTTSPVVLPAAPMDWPLKIEPSPRARTAGTVTASFSCVMHPRRDCERTGPPSGRSARERRNGIFEAYMHKAGGVLLEHPPALCGLTRSLGFGESLKSPTASVHVNICRQCALQALCKTPPGRGQAPSPPY